MSEVKEQKKGVRQYFYQQIITSRHERQFRNQLLYFTMRVDRLVANVNGGHWRCTSICKFSNGKSWYTTEPYKFRRIIYHVIIRVPSLREYSATAKPFRFTLFLLFAKLIVIVRSGKSFCSILAYSQFDTRSEECVITTLLHCLLELLQGRRRIYSYSTIL